MELTLKITTWDRTAKRSYASSNGKQSVRRIGTGAFGIGHSLFVSTLLKRRGSGNEKVDSQVLASKSRFKDGTFGKKDNYPPCFIEIGLTLAYGQ
jgi:hypothetical protein